MHFDEFKLERWLSTHSGKYNFAGVNPPPLKLSELVEKIDTEMLLTYSSTNGSQELRQEICGLYTNRSPNQVIVTTGTAEANYLITNALIDPGDELILITPTYLQVLGVTKAIGGIVKISPLIEDECFKPNLEEINELCSSKTKAIFVTNPNNPTGGTISEHEIRAICEIAEDHDAYVIFDEVIRGLELDGNVSVSPTDIYEKGISTASISKLGLLGLRIGWATADETLVKRCWSIKDYTTLSHSGLSEYLATIALQEKNLKWMRERARGIFKRNLPIFRDWVRSCGSELSCVIPTAGGSAFPKYSLEVDSHAFCERVLKESGILLSPGDYFGSAKHFRFRYGGHDVQTLTTVMQQLTPYIHGLK